jgi:GAF domain-containing protein
VGADVDIGWPQSSPVHWSAAAARNQSMHPEIGGGGKRHTMDVPKMLANMALEAETLETPAEVIERIAHYARLAIDSDDSGILLVKARGRVETPAGTSERIAEAHALQGELDEGPCIDAVRDGDAAYVTPDAGVDPRWPNWGPRVAKLGYNSVVSVRLETRGRRYGSLNSYSAQHDAFSPEDVEVMQYLAVHASVAIAMTQTVDDLHTALQTRKIIGHAQGVLMAVYDIDAEDAFRYLRRLSMEGNRKLFDVAAEVVAQRHELRKLIH